MNRVSEHPAGSRQWHRDWSDYWMNDAQQSARLARMFSEDGRDEVVFVQPFRRMAVESLRRALRDYKRSFDAPDASEWPGFRP